MTTKVPVIQLQGKDYAKVKDRLQAFKKDFPTSNIRTSYEFKDGFAIFEAIIYPKYNEEHSIATGHSFGKLDKQKSFEKLETIAVGRALGLAGYGADGDIASFDEMQDFITENNIIEKQPFQKAQFRALIEMLNDGGTIFGNGWIEDNKDYYNITDSIQKKILKIYTIYKKNQKITISDTDNVWKDIEEGM